MSQYGGKISRILHPPSLIKESWQSPQIQANAHRWGPPPRSINLYWLKELRHRSKGQDRRKCIPLTRRTRPLSAHSRRTLRIQAQNDPEWDHRDYHISEGRILDESTFCHPRKSLFPSSGTETRELTPPARRTTSTYLNLGKIYSLRVTRQNHFKTSFRTKNRKNTPRTTLKRNIRPVRRL